MEQFAALYREPRVREELRAALDQGRGVFRAFKNTLARNPEAERRWHTFKERELRRRVLAWYDDLRISWGLERLGPEPEETEELLLEDFRFRPPAGGDDEAAAALRPGTAPPLVVAETAAGDFAGYGALRPGGPPAVILEVAPEYRGIGLGEALLERVLEAAPPGPLILDLPAEFESFAGALRRHSFSPLSTRYLKR
jgi:GNAT superfamily N-acetyltransferase